MPSARNLLLASGSQSSGKPPLPTYPEFSESVSSVIYATELTWIDDDASQTVDTFRNFWRGELTTVRYPLQNIAVTFFQLGQEYSNSDGTKIVAQVFDYRDGVTVVDSGPQDVLDLNWSWGSEADDFLWSNHIDVVNFGDRLLLTVHYCVDPETPVAATIGLAFCSVTLDLDTLELTVHWEDAYKFEGTGASWWSPNERTLGSDPWGDVVCQLYHWHTVNDRWEVSFFKLTQGAVNPNAVEAVVFDHADVIAQLGLTGIRISSSALNAMDMPPVGERLLSPWAHLGVEHYKDDLWIVGLVCGERREEYSLATDFELHWPIYVWLIEITETSFTVVDELRLSDGFGDIPSGVRLDDALFYRPQQWMHYTQHGIACIDNSCFILYQDYNDSDGDHARYARVNVSDTSLTFLHKSDFPLRSVDYNRIESYWSLTKCDEKVVFFSAHYEDWGSNNSFIEMHVVDTDGTFIASNQGIRDIFEANIPSSAWVDNTARGIGNEAVRQTFDVQNSKIIPMVLPDAEEYNNFTFVLSHLDAFLAP